MTIMMTMIVMTAAAAAAVLTTTASAAAAAAAVANGRRVRIVQNNSPTSREHCVFIIPRSSDNDAAATINETCL